MHEIAQAFLLVYAGLFPIVNPVGNAPIFLALTCNHTERVRHDLARRIAVSGFVLLLASVFVGSHVLQFSGSRSRCCGWPAVWWSPFSAGGCCATGSAADERLGEVGEGGPVDAFYPLTMPLTVGPGSIAVAVALGAQRPRNIEGSGELALLVAGAVAGLAAIAVTVFFCYRFADRMVRVLGRKGINVLVRLSAFILLCIGIQIIWSGYSALMGAGT